MLSSPKRNFCIEMMWNKNISVCVCVCFKVHWAGATMEHRVTQISREDLEELREAFNKIG